MKLVFSCDFDCQNCEGRARWILIIIRGGVKPVEPADIVNTKVRTYYNILIVLRSGMYLQQKVRTSLRQVLTRRVELVH